MKHWKLGSLVAMSCGFLVWSCGDDGGGSGAGGAGGSAGKGGSTSGGSAGKASGGSTQGGSAGKGGSAGSNTAGSAGTSTGGQGGEAGSSLGGQGGEAGATGGAAGSTGTAGEGGAGGAEACGGTATPCDELSNPECATANGCTLGQTCTGTPDDCGDRDMADTCAQLMGCSWNGTMCVDTPNACNTYNGGGPCEAAGCTWTGCSGTAATCSSLDVVQCAMQAGCSVQ